MESMQEKLDQIKQRYDEVNDLIIQPDIIQDQKRYVKLNKEYKELQHIVGLREKYLELTSRLEEARDLLHNASDDEMREMAQAEKEELEPELEKLEETIRFELIPKDPEDSKNAVMEIRAGAGGDEASIFAGDLFKLYSRYCEQKAWKTEVVDFSEGTMGGYKEIVMAVKGEDVYGTLKFESGVHRVQRVPQTETQGRVHTSAASVAVLPEAEDVEVDINPSDLNIDTYRSGGPGGQHANMTDSAVRITHAPSGVVVSCQDEASQHKNKAKAMRVLKARLLEKEREEQRKSRREDRREQVPVGHRGHRVVRDDSEDDLGQTREVHERAGSGQLPGDDPFERLRREEVQYTGNDVEQPHHRDQEHVARDDLDELAECHENDQPGQQVFRESVHAPSDPADTATD